jgi:hypothetical protein
MNALDVSFQKTTLLREIKYSIAAPFWGGGLP